jgi:hypothetical protein
MSAPGQYRAKAAGYAELAKTASSSDEKRDFQDRVRSFSVLADNEQWLADNHDRTLHPSQRDEPRELALTAQEDRMLRCLGAAVLMRWHTLPSKLQRELVGDAGAMADLLDTSASSAGYSPC